MILYLFYCILFSKLLYKFIFIFYRPEWKESDECDCRKLVDRFWMRRSNLQEEKIVSLEEKVRSLEEALRRQEETIRRQDDIIKNFNI